MFGLAVCPHKRPIEGRFGDVDAKVRLSHLGSSPVPPGAAMSPAHVLAPESSLFMQARLRKGVALETVRLYERAAGVLGACLLARLDRLEGFAASPAPPLSYKEGLRGLPYARNEEVERAVVLTGGLRSLQMLR